MTIRRGAIHLVAAALLAASTPFVSGDSPVWFWFSTCRGPLMAIEVRLDEVTLYKGSFPSCLASRTSSHSQGQASRLEFVFRPERAIVWEGYREEADTTAPNDRIECNLWQAGADPDVMVIGVTFLDRRKIYMNTLHIIKPSERSQTDVADGLLVITYPVGDGNATRH